MLDSRRVFQPAPAVVNRYNWIRDVFFNQHLLWLTVLNLTVLNWIRGVKNTSQIQICWPQFETPKLCNVLICDLRTPAETPSPPHWGAARP